MQKDIVAEIREILNAVLEKTKSGEIQWHLGKDGAVETEKFKGYTFRLSVMDIEVPITQTIELPSELQGKQKALQRVIQFFAYKGDAVVLFVTNVLFPQLSDVLWDLVMTTRDNIDKQVDAQIHELLEALTT